ncbi:MAG: hypothetical protein DWQ47_02840 [Acidobacteria bacterium]|nr:MAG: hypothetical protein DWQ32_06390 [Acidobacteriota bacterium]REK01344.1 MAG: hypothetical protein DWQ38_02825 [Acidobacteriota bacterium]REK14300.1 MAG: hypothetical protein DWQ43_12080 [Acidobacteriota bacterium]REK45015.1 MAG: hypothetical protein DWQ47_02840 [Acidobacteriota bacterium]
MVSIPSGHTEQSIDATARAAIWNFHPLYAKNFESAVRCDMDTKTLGFSDNSICCLLVLVIFVISGCGIGKASDSRTPGSRALETAVSPFSEKTSDAEYPARSGGDVESIYTDIGFEECETIEVEHVNETPYSTRILCKGVGGYDLEVVDSDARQYVYLVYPDGKKHDLRFSKIVSSAFSEVGQKAEWRVIRDGDKVKPVAVIIRYIFSINAAISSDKASYLTVTKITDEDACITDVVENVKDQNEKARRLADESGDASCKEPKRHPTESDL